MSALPSLSGQPISISAQPHLTAHRGDLFSACLERGTPVHAASFIRARKIILDSDLYASPRTLRLIAVHEIFHFVWARLGNRVRHEFAGLLVNEIESGAIGELGESAAIKKDRLCAVRRSCTMSLWRDYACESFCDTAAWLYSAVQRHPSFTLAKRWSTRRKIWFHDAAGERAWNC